MPSEILHKYPYSANPEIILCMIENKKLDYSIVSGINTDKFDKQWKLII